MISNAKSEKEKRVLTHIMKEEQEHLSELMSLMKCKV
jgi:rubrerythrin